MTALVAGALAFPTVIFTALLIVVLLYWVFVFVGTIDLHAHGAEGALDGAADGLDGAADGATCGAGDGALDGGHDLDADAGLDADADADAGGHSAGGGFLGSMGLAGVPVTVSMSFLVLYCWALCMVLSWQVGKLALTGALFFAASLGVVLLALLVSVPAAAVSIRPLKGLFVVHQAPRRAELVGRVCTVTTQRVDGRFGQAEIASGGTVLLVQVRCEAPNELKKGRRALVADYDKEREVYLVTPLHTGLGD